MDYFVIPKRIRSRIGKDGLVVILGVSKGTIQRNIIEPLQKIWGTKLVGDINSYNICHMFGEDVYCLGAEKVNQVSKLRGSSIKYCYGDEITDWNKEVFDMLKSRLDKPYSCFDGACNPAQPTHWVKEFIDSDADIYLQQYTIFDNPFLDPKFVEELCKEYNGTILYDRYILGLWKRAEGSIYRKFADNPKEFIASDELLRSVKDITIGVDFGGNKSGHAFVASGRTFNYSDMIALSSERHFGDYDPNDINRLLLDFIQRVTSKYGQVQYVYWDNAETVLGRGIKRAIEAKFPTIMVRPARKNRIKDRIDCLVRLIGVGKFWITEDCATLKDALSDAVYDSKKQTDERLDDGSVDVDSLDSFEYSFERDMKRYIDQLR